MSMTICSPSNVADSRTSRPMSTSCPSSPPVAMMNAVTSFVLGSQMTFFTCPAPWPSFVLTFASSLIRIVAPPALAEVTARRVPLVRGAATAQGHDDRGEHDRGADVGLRRARLAQHDRAEDDGDDRHDHADHVRVRDGPMADQPGVDDIRPEGACDHEKHDR